MGGNNKTGTPHDLAPSTPSSSTTTCIAQKCQGSSVAPIVQSLPRPLQHHRGSVDPLLPPWGVHEADTYGETRGGRPQNDTGFFRDPSPRLPPEQTKRAASQLQHELTKSSQRDDDEPTKLKTTGCTDSPYTARKDEVCGRADRRAALQPVTRSGTCGRTMANYSVSHPRHNNGDATSRILPRPHTEWANDGPEANNLGVEASLPPPRGPRGQELG